MWHVRRDLSPDYHKYSRAYYIPTPPPAPILVRAPGMRSLWCPPPSSKVSLPQWENYVLPLNTFDTKLFKKNPLWNNGSKLEISKTKRLNETIKNTENNKVEHCEAHQENNISANQELVLIKTSKFESECSKAVRDFNPAALLSDDDGTDDRRSANTSYKDEEMTEEEGEIVEGLSATNVNISRWALGARALRDTHVRLVRRQLRQIQRINHALDRLTR